MNDSDQHIDVDDDGLDVPAMRTRRQSAPDSLAAFLALHRALPRGLIARLRKETGLCLVIAVPSASWCGPVLTAARDAIGHGSNVDFDSAKARMVSSERVYVMRDGTERTMGRADRSCEGLPAHVGMGGSVVGVAADVSLLPSQVMLAADVHVRVLALTPSDVARIVRLVTDSGRVPRIDATVAAGLDPQDLALAIRPRTTPSSCVRRMRGLVDARRPYSDQTVPRLEDLAGYGEAHDWGMALVRDLDAFRTDPSSMPLSALTRSVLLAGPPGTGKTLYASALARSLGVPLVLAGYADWQTSGGGYLNDVMSAMRATFAEAREAANRSGGIAVLFIDELDSVPDRTSLVGGRNDGWWTTVVNQLLTLTELASPARQNVVLIGATNHAARIDPALVRSGRFDRTIRLHLPDAEDVVAIMRTHLRDDLRDVDLAPVAALAPPSSGADVARWVREARLVARARGTPLALGDVVAQVMPPETRMPAFVRNVALHEAAHAVVALRVGHDALVSVSVVSAGDGVSGRTTFQASPEEPTTRDRLERRLVARLAGRAADVRFGHADTGSVSDLATATAQVAALHFAFGLGDTLASIGDVDDVMTSLRHDVRMREVVEADLVRLYARAQALVAEHSSEIEAVADALVERRVLSGADVERILASRSGRRIGRRP